MKKSAEIKYPDFNGNLTQFIDHIDSINETLPFVMVLISMVDKEREKELQDFIKSKNLKKETTKVKDTSDKTDVKEEDVVSLKFEDFLVFEGLQNNSQVSSLAIKLIPESLFVTLISQFDAFIGKLIKTIFELHPEKLNSSEKNINYSKLSEFQSLEEAKDFIVEKEVESVLRENHAYHFEWLEKKLEMPLRKDLPVWLTFIEITERRNLFVHNQGEVSTQYISTCQKMGVQLEPNLKVGSQLYVSTDYFKKAYMCLYELSVKLTQVIWRKLIPNDLENSDAALNDICYKLLHEEDFELADILLHFATVLVKKHHNEINKNVFLINKALSKYLSGKKDECYEVLKSKDWSACSLNFRLAVDVLNEDFKKALKLMDTIGTSDEVPKHAYQTWPLFSTIRKEVDFQERFRKIFKEEYKIIERPSPKVIKLIERRKKSEAKHDKSTATNMVLPKAGLDEQKLNSSAKSSSAPAGRTKPSRRKSPSTKK